MPRQARFDALGALHHIMVRGINKTDIFTDDQDKARFLERLGENVTEGKCSIYAWVLMDNHVHLLFKSGSTASEAKDRRDSHIPSLFFLSKNIPFPAPNIHSDPLLSKTI